MDLNLNGKTALVTGASAGLGVGIAWMLAHEGCTLVLTARRKDRLDSLADEIEQKDTSDQASSCKTLWQKGPLMPSTAPPGSHMTGLIF